ncbi:MAG TPA: acetolactate synthase small subunit [Acidimicrobiales bacterium]|nr:acetolactate synthase small subunit [Acidimicrobiales bacterium]
MNGRPNGKAPYHLLSVRVENRAGVLARVAGLFARRGFNIVSLVVAPTQDERFSRISIVVDVESAPLHQVVDQLGKLINVVEISELHPDRAREAELLLATVGVSPSRAPGFVELVGRFGARVIEEAEDAAMVMAVGDTASLDEFEAGLERFGIVEIQRTGRIGLPTLSPTA